MKDKNLKRRKSDNHALLTERTLEVVKLYADLSPTKIARQLGISVVAVRNHLSKAKLRLGLASFLELKMAAKAGVTKFG